MRKGRRKRREGRREEGIYGLIGGKEDEKS